jgi:hypothetical protein
MTAVRPQYMLHPVPCPTLVTPQFAADQVLAVVCRFDVPSHKIVSSAGKFNEAPPHPPKETGSLSSVAEGLGAALSVKHEDGIFGKPKRIQLVHCRLCRAVVLHHTSNKLAWTPAWQFAARTSNLVFHFSVLLFSFLSAEWTVTVNEGLEKH